VAYIETLDADGNVLSKQARPPQQPSGP